MKLGKIITAVCLWRSDCILHDIHVVDEQLLGSGFLFHQNFTVPSLGLQAS